MTSYGSIRFLSDFAIMSNMHFSVAMTHTLLLCIPQVMVQNGSNQVARLLAFPALL